MRAIMSFAPGRNGTVFAKVPSTAFNVAITTSYLYWVENPTPPTAIPLHDDYRLVRRAWPPAQQR
jgi:hypothetical protein